MFLFCFYNHFFFTYCLVSVCLYSCPFTPSRNVAINVFLRTRSPKSTAKLVQNNVYCFFITIFRLAVPAFFRFTDVTELMQESQYYIDGECRNKNCLKGRGGNDVQHKLLVIKFHHPKRQTQQMRKIASNCHPQFFYIKKRRLTNLFD